MDQTPQPIGCAGTARAGIVCTGEACKQAVKLIFARGASLEDPRGLFNSSLEGNTRRAIGIREDEVLDAEAFKAFSGHGRGKSTVQRQEVTRPWPDVSRESLRKKARCAAHPGTGADALEDKGTVVQLIGMLDSPYVRRVAISLQLLGLPFEHRSISVFRGIAQFKPINPVVKAPSLICDDGEVLMDSTLILQYAEALAAPRKSLMPTAMPDVQRTLRVVGLALAACEKSVQIFYEHELRPADKLHEPWLSRITEQALAAYAAIEAEILKRPLSATSSSIDQAGVSVAVAWEFTQKVLPELAPPAHYPALREFSAKAEALPAFMAAPHGSNTYLRAD